MTDRTVTVIEDDPAIAALIEDLLVELGFCVVHRQDLAGGPVDRETLLVITDLAARTHDAQASRDWVAGVRAAFPAAAVIVSTAHAWATRAGAAELGADAVLAKPFDIGVFTATVESVLAR